MDAGRELDATIAEKVMGWTDTDENVGWGVAPGEQWISNIASPFQEVPPYSTDIGAAWAVMERLKMRGYTMTLFVYGIGVQIRIESGGAVVTRTEANTAPLAICRAALETVMEDRG